MLITLFGLDLNVDPITGEVDPPNTPGVTVLHGGWDVALDASKTTVVLKKVDLRIPQTATDINVAATVSIADSGGKWILKDVKAASSFRIVQNNTMAGAAALLAGPLALASTTPLRAVRVSNGRLGVTFAFGSQSQILPLSRVPLSITPGEGLAVLNLAALELEAEANFMNAATGVVANTVGGNGLLFPCLHRSQPFRIPLGSIASVISARFTPILNLGYALPLHADVRERTAPLGAANPVITPVEVADWILGVDIGGQPADAVLKKVELSLPGKQPGDPDTGPMLRVLTIATPDNQDLTIQPKRPILLWARAQHGSGVGTFQIAAQADADLLAPPATHVHGPVPKASIAIRGNAVLKCSEYAAHPPVGPNAPPIDFGLLADVTMPWLASDAPILKHPKAGESYLKPGDTNGAVDVWTFDGGAVGLPLLSAEFTRHASGASPHSRESHYRALNAYANGLRHLLQASVHDGGMVEGPANATPLTIAELYPVAMPTPLTRPAPSRPRLLCRLADGFRAIFGLKPAPVIVKASPAAVRGAASQGGLTPNGYCVKRHYGRVSVEVCIPGNELPDYLVLDEKALFDPNGYFSLDRTGVFSSLRTIIPRSFGKNPASPLPPAILKLNAALTLDEIFTRENLHHTVLDLGPDVDFVGDVLDSRVKDKGWIGLILFNTEFEFASHPFLKALLPGAENGVPTLRFRYVAFAPSKDFANPDITTSINARVWYKNNAPKQMPLEQGERNEATYRFEYVDAQWIDSRLVRFDAGGMLSFRSSFGMQNANQGDILKWVHVKLTGHLEQPAPGDPSGVQRIRFRGEFDSALNLLDESQNPPGIVQQVTFKSAEVVLDGDDGARVDFDGSITLNNLGLGDWLDKYITAAGQRVIDFQKLGLKLPSGGSLNYEWIEFRYPSIKLNLNIPHFNLFGIPQLSMCISRIGVDWDKAFNWGNTLHLLEGKSWKAAERIFMVDIRLTVGDLPELAGKLFDKLNFDFSLGLGQLDDGNGKFRFSTDGFKAGLSAAGFENLNLDLARIIELHLGAVRIENVDYGDGLPVPWFILENVSLRVLGETIIKDLTLEFFTTRDGRRGFLCYLRSPVPDFGFLKISWILIGQNLTLSDKLAEAILAIDTDQAKEGTLFKDIQNAAAGHDLIPLAADQPQSPWIFAAGISILQGLVAGKFLFQDRAYYGLMLRGDIFKDWFGYDFAISVLYIRRQRAEEDSFVVSFTVPAVDMASFRFMGGVISIEVAANGNFFLDVGFPWLQTDGLRAWQRTLGAICTPLQGSGGAYIGYRRTVFYDQTYNNENYAILDAGFALQAGIGANYGGGMFQVWVRAGVYVIAEGSVALKTSSQSIDGLRLVAAIGLLVEGHGSLNWWIISANVGVIAQAEARATLVWGRDPQDLKTEFDRKKINLQLDFSLTAAASASACIGSGWFKVCRGISTSVSMPFRHTVMIG